VLTQGIRFSEILGVPSGEIIDQIRKSHAFVVPRYNAAVFS